MARRELTRAHCRVGLHNGLQIIDVVEIHIAQVLHRRVDVARHGNIDQEQRPVAPHPHQTRHLVSGQQDLRAAGRGHQDVRLLHRAEAIVKLDRPAPTFRGQSRRAVKRAVRDQHRMRALLCQVAHHRLAHLPGPDGDYRLAGQAIAENLLRQLDRHAPDRGRSPTHPRAGPYLLDRLEGFLEQPVEHLAGEPRVAGPVVGPLDLAGNLRLTQHHRVQPARHAEQVPHRVLVFVDVDMRPEIGPVIG